MNRKMAWTTSALLVAVAATGLFGNVSAQNPAPYPCVASSPEHPGAPPGSWHCSSIYELGLTGDILTIREDCAILGGFPCTTLFLDNNLDIGGVIYDGCYSALHAGNAIPASDKSINRDWPHCFPPASAWSLETVYMRDDIFGNDIGGFYCIDLNNDGTCGSNADGEFGEAFCSAPADPPPFFVPNFANALVYFVDGPILQSVDCPGTANPIGGTSGTINIWISPSGPPECSDGVDNDGDGYTDWGYGAGWPDRGTAFPGQIGGGCDHISDDSE